MLAPRRLLAAAALTLGAAVAGASPAPAAEPIMPLDQVHPGQRCLAFSVVRGTEISSFDAQVVDVVRGEEVRGDARILVRVSGPAVDATGLGPGFSGSPMLCPDGAGVLRNAGAISETVGEYGGKLALATPIEQVLGEPVDVPAGTPAAPGPARSLAGPLSFSGLSEPVAAALRRAAKATRRQITVAPAVPGGGFAPQALVPGASMAVGIATGDLNAAAIGTVTYVDGDRLWGLGHQLDGTGRRALLLQDAYVYTVVSNPNATEEATTYKLASAGTTHGTLTNDAPDAVAGRLGAFPRAFPLRIVARDLDTGRVQVHQTAVTDERPLGEPSGQSALATVGPVALAEAAFETLRGSPTDQSGSMCLRIEVRERRRPMRFCNRYVAGGGPSAAGAPMVSDMVKAVSLLDSFQLGTLTITKVEASIRLRRERRQAYLLDASAPTVARRGRTITVRARAKVVRGRTITRRVRVRVPRTLRRGVHELVLSGTPADQAGGLEELGELFEFSLGGDGGEGGDEEEQDDPGPRSVEELAAQVADLDRPHGVTASFRRPGGRRASTRRVLDDPQMRFSGSARTLVLVR